MANDIAPALLEKLQKALLKSLIKTKKFKNYTRLFRKAKRHTQK